MVLAEFFEFAARADAGDGGVEPDGQQDSRVEGRCPGPTGPGIDLVQQRVDVEADDEIPNGPGLMLGGKSGSRDSQRNSAWCRWA